MTDKQTRNFIERKYDIMKRNATKELRKQLEDNYDKKAHIFKELRNRIIKDIEKLCNKHNFIFKDKSIITIYDGRIEHEENCKIQVQINEIYKKLDKEKLELIDEISILGIKDSTIKEKLSYLLNIKED